MSYEKTTWQNGDTITAEKLNKIENGIEEVFDKGYEVDNNTETRIWMFKFRLHENNSVDYTDATIHSSN